jgi:hypothetical protein
MANPDTTHKKDVDSQILFWTVVIAILTIVLVVIGVVDLERKDTGVIPTTQNSKNPIIDITQDLEAHRATLRAAAATQPMEPR